MHFGGFKVSSQAMLEPVGTLLKREARGALQSSLTRSACSSKGLFIKRIVCNTSNPKCFLHTKFIIEVHVCPSISFQ